MKKYLPFILIFAVFVYLLLKSKTEKVITQEDVPLKKIENPVLAILSNLKPTVSE